MYGYELKNKTKKESKNNETEALVAQGHLKKNKNKKREGDQSQKSNLKKMNMPFVMGKVIERTT